MIILILGCQFLVFNQGFENGFFGIVENNFFYCILVVFNWFECIEFEVGQGCQKCYGGE